MSWENPKTTWGQPGQTVPGVDDFNRIEGNIDILGKYDRAPGYGTATGTNTKAITLSPAPSSYYEGLCFAFKNSVENTGAVTINVNGLGAKSVLKSNGSALSSGDLKANSVYTVRYNGTSFILQGERGDFSVGDTIPEVRLLPLSGGMGAEIWSKTDVPQGRGITVDSAGNVYVAHYVSSGKTVRKLDSAGNEIWSKTDVPYGYGIAVDSAGNVYVTHYASSGKTVRKLDSAGNEIWSKTDVSMGRGITVDSAGNVYVAHNVSNGEKAVRKLDSAGNEIWSKTDVPQGRGITVDSAGNVYVTHFVSSGGKAVRRLDSAGNEIWSNTDVPYGYGIAVDSAGNVYVAHNVISGKTVRKLDGNKYFQIVG
jgi:pantoate kinase